MANSTGQATGNAGFSVPPQPTTTTIDNRLPGVMNLRSNQTGRPLSESIANFIITQEEMRGGFFAFADDRQTYFFDGTAKRLYSLGTPKAPNPDFAAFLTMTYGVNSAENPLCGYCIAKFDAYARTNGRKPAVKRFSWYNKENKALYLSRYNGTVFKLTGTEIKTIDNGTDVLFIDDDHGNFVEPDIAAHGVLLPSIIDDLQYEKETAGGLTPETQKIILTAWLFCVAFSDLMSGSPILLLEGEKGSGKTSAIKRIQLLTHGEINNRPIGKHDEADFGVLLLRSPIALLDNLDSYIDWLPDALAAYATGAVWARRAKYTNDTEFLIKPKSFIAVTTRNPASFRRDDVADRCLIIRLSRRSGGFQSENQIMEGILSKRNMLYGEWLYYLNIMVELLKTRQSSISNHRLADYAFLTQVIGEALDIPNVDKALIDMQAERDEFTLEGDPLINILELWLTDQNIGREISAGDLHKELHLCASLNSIQFPYKNSKSLASRLRDANGALQRRITIVRNNKNHQSVYAFFRKE